MREAMPACFRGCTAGAPPPTAAAAIETTSVYETRLGLVALSWRRAVVGLSLRVDIRIDSSPALSGREDPDLLRLRVRPCVLWKRRGSKRFSLDSGADGGYSSAEIAWDLSAARFPSSSGTGTAPEPESGFFVSVSLDGEQILVAGDLGSGICPSAVLVSRHESVALREPRSYRTTARFGGRIYEVSVEIVEKGKEEGKERDLGMIVAVDGKRVLHVRRIRWKFRGTERAEICGGDHIRISWDLNNWLFPPDPAAAGGDSDPGRAVFLFRFERDGEWEGSGGSMIRSAASDRSCWSDSSGSGRRRKGGGGSGRRVKGKMMLGKTSSSASSSSSTSSGSGSSVMDWDSVEEAKLRAADGFTLLLYAWKR